MENILSNDPYDENFLKEVFGEGKYKLVRGTITSNTDMVELERKLRADKTISLINQSDNKYQILWDTENPGWLAFEKARGITLTNSQKIGKRVTMMMRRTRFQAMFKYPNVPKVGPVGALDYHPLWTGDDAWKNQTPDEQVRYLDGANVMSDRLLLAHMANAVVSSRRRHHVIALKRVAIVTPVFNWFHGLSFSIDVRVPSASVRFSCKPGEVKGDLLFGTRESMGGFDFLYFEDNLKPEVSTDFMYFIIEPFPDTTPGVWTDEQSMSWLNEWLFTRESLNNDMSDLNRKVLRDLSNGIFPLFWTKGRPDDERDKDDLINQLQEQTAEWVDAGMDLNQSIFFMERIGQGHANMLNPPSGRKRWPVSCAWYLHVATDSWINMTGRDWEETPRGSVQFDPISHRLVYNDEDFAALYDRHGGWDLDDSVKAIYRTFQGERVVFVLRSPNSYGEYAIMKYGGDESPWDDSVKDYPTWVRPGDTEEDDEIIEFPILLEPADLPEQGRIPFNTELSVSYDDISTTGSSAPTAATYTKDEAINRLKIGFLSIGVFGRNANAEMVYQWSTGSYRTSAVGPMEWRIDSCTQNMTLESLEAVELDTINCLTELTESSAVIDRNLWKQRINNREERGIEGPWTALWLDHKLHTAMFMRNVKEIAQVAATRQPEDLFLLGQLEADRGRRLYNWYFYLVRESMKRPDRREDAPKKRPERDDYLWVNAYMTEFLNRKLNPLERENVMLAVAAWAYSKARRTRYDSGQKQFFFSDTPLCQGGYLAPVSPLDDTNLFDIYLRAIRRYKLNAESAVSRLVCHKCGTATPTSNRAAYQSYVTHRGVCKNCR